MSADEHTAYTTLDVKTLISNLRTKFEKSIYRGIMNEGDYSFITSIMALLLHNKYVLTTIKLGNSFMKKIYELLLRKRQTKINEVIQLLPNFDNNIKNLDFIVYLFTKCFDIAKQFKFNNTEFPIITIESTEKPASTKDILPEERFLSFQCYPNNLLLHVSRIDDENNIDEIPIPVNLYLKFQSEVYRLESIVFRKTITEFACLVNIKGTYFVFDNELVCLAKEQYNQNMIEKRGFLYLYTKMQNITSKKREYDELLDKEMLDYITPGIIHDCNKGRNSALNKVITPKADNYDGNINLPDVVDKPINYLSIDFTFKNGKNSIDDSIILEERYHNMFGILNVKPDGIPITPINEYEENTKVKTVVDILNHLNSILRKYKSGYDTGQENLINIAERRNININDTITNKLKKIADLITKTLIEKIDQSNEISQEELKTLVIDGINEENLLPDSQSDADTNDVNLNLTYDSSSESEDEEYENFFNLNYDWRERDSDIIAEIYNIDTLTTNTQTDAMKRADKAKDFITRRWKERTQEEVISQTVEEFIANNKKDLQIHMGEEKPIYKDSYLKKLIGKIRNKGEIEKTKKKGASNPKITEDVKRCLICTCLDFPLWSTKDRLKYLQSPKGPYYQVRKEDQISESTINDFLCKHKFVYKKVSFSPKSRNTIGARIFRAVFASLIKRYLINDKVILCFIDESAVVATPSTSTGRGFVGITPIAIHGFDSQKLSLLTCVIPAYGTISRWINGSVTNDLYANFIAEAQNIIRTAIGDGTQSIVMLQDNCLIHSTATVVDETRKRNVFMLNNCPYSPQTNYVVENYFGNCKTQLGSSDIPILILTEGIEQAIINEWKRANVVYGSAKATFNSFKAWLKVLIDCENCKCINSGPYHSEEEINIETYRCFKTGRAQNPEALSKFERKELQKRINPLNQDPHDRRDLPPAVIILRRTRSANQERRAQRREQNRSRVARLQNPEDIANTRRDENDSDQTD